MRLRDQKERVEIIQAFAEEDRLQQKTWDRRFPTANTRRWRYKTNSGLKAQKRGVLTEQVEEWKEQETHINIFIKAPILERYIGTSKYPYYPHSNHTSGTHKSAQPGLHTKIMIWADTFPKCPRPKSPGQVPHSTRDIADF
ncbi:MAG: hypothetical protein Q9194_004784 [Teloschistes cf. exilis]